MVVGVVGPSIEYHAAEDFFAVEFREPHLADPHSKHP